MARELGFASWPKLQAHAGPASRVGHTRLLEADLTWIGDRAHSLLRRWYSADPAALEQIREWHPRFTDRSYEEIRQAPFTVDDARLVYAREHGFDTWGELATRVKALASNPAVATTEPFMAAFGSLRSGDVGGLAALLRTAPRLAFERGTNGNSLLNLAVSFAGKPDWKGGVSGQHPRLEAAPSGGFQPAEDRRSADRKRRGPGRGSARRGRHSAGCRVVLGASRGRRVVRSRAEQSPRRGRAWPSGTRGGVLSAGWLTDSGGVRGPWLLPSP